MSKVFCIYKETGLINLISLVSVFSVVDSEADISGDSGETKIKAVWGAIEQTKLNGGINDTDDPVTIALDAARFADTTLNVLLIGTEKLLMSAGFGTNSLTASRAYDGTSIAAHADDAPIYLCYTIKDPAVVALDETGGDEAGWVTFCLDSGGSPDGSYNSHPTPLDLGANLDPADKIAFHRKLIVPASQPAQKKTDILLKTTGTLEEYSVP